MERDVKRFKSHPNVTLKFSFSAQLINELEHTVTQSENQGLIERFRSIKEEMVFKDLIEDVTIEQMVLEPISASPDSTISDDLWGDKYTTNRNQDPGKFRKGRHGTNVFNPFTKKNKFK